jgi:hypothetical protein
MPYPHCRKAQKVSAPTKTPEKEELPNQRKSVQFLSTQALVTAQSERKKVLIYFL